MSTAKSRIACQILLPMCLLLCACVSAEEPENVYDSALSAYRAFMAGELSIDNGTTTIAPVPNGKYALQDMNDDGIPELVMPLFIFQHWDPDTRELESACFLSAIFLTGMERLLSGLPALTAITVLRY